jgi:predicted ATP-grasp superfamily ATP-dependent carboligase
VAAAKRAGYKVTAIDAFLDKQTVELADVTLLVDYNRNGFSSDSLLNAVSRLDAGKYQGFVYGSGFEAQPELLEKIAKTIPLIGNTPATVRVLKSTCDFFTSLQRCNIPYPAVFDVLPDGDNFDAEIYLKKFAGGSGGTHIQFANTDSAPLSNCYYQRYMTGLPVSLLFIAQDKMISVIGFNEQWVNATESMPFRYGGAVSNITLSNGVQQQLIEAAEKLSLAFGLRGLNSLDVIVHNEMVYVLEINPRLSATVDLYESAQINLMDLHLQTCIHDVSVKSDIANNLHYFHTLSKSSKAHAILYAPFDCLLNNDISWPDWVVDSPHHTMQFLAGEPVCTVLAVADDSDEAKQLAQIRVKMLQMKLQQNS